MTPEHPLIAALVERRIMQGVTLAELERRTGYTVKQFSQWELERFRPRLAALCDWAQALGMDIVLEVTNKLPPGEFSE